MICPTPIDSTPRTSPETFTNWARALTFTAATGFRPSTRGEIVEIIREAEARGQRVKWTGSVWSFMGNYISNDVVIESDGITDVIPSTLILDQLTLLDPSLRGSLVHIKGGTKVFNVNRILQGLPAVPGAEEGDREDEKKLGCSGARALPTLGGSGGQSIAGVMATGSHGGDIFLPPIADAVMAIHLIGPGGQEWWIERSSGLTAGTEADTQRQLQTIVSNDPRAGAELCSGVLVKKDDDFFRSVLVSVGRMGFVYSLVVKTVPAFKLKETRSRDDTWESLKPTLTASAFPGFAAGKRFLTLVINPFVNNNEHECTVVQRVEEDCNTTSNPADPPGDFMSTICQKQDVRVYIPLLLAVLAGLIAAVVALTALAYAEFAAATALAAIPIIGWALAAALYTAAAVTVAAITALGVTIAALTALIAYLATAGSLTSGELVAAIANFAYAFGLKELMKAVLTQLFNSLYPLTPKNSDSWIDISWKIMDTYAYGAENFCQKVDSMEIAFDVAAAQTEKDGYLGFIDDVLTIFNDLFDRNIAVALIMSLRYTSKTTALIGMSKFPTTCHIEIPLLRNFAGNAEFIARVQRSAINHGGVPHWGQLMPTYTGSDIDNLHGSDLTTWRNTLTALIRAGGGSSNLTFSNDFTVTYHLEPFGLPDNCASNKHFPPVNLGAFDGAMTDAKSADGDVTVDKVDNGFTLELTSQHGGITITHKVDQHSSATLTACGGITIGEKIDQHSQATILAHGDVTIGQTIDQWSRGVIITSTKGGIDIGQKVDQHSQATLTAATTVHIGQKIDQHSEVTIVAQGDITIDEGIDQHSVADITSLNGSITIGQAVDGEAEATLRAPNGNITIVQKVAGGASVKWSALSFTCPDQSGGTVTPL